MTEVKKGRRERSRATREAIVGAAHVEFVAHGFHGTTIAAIAERAGVAQQTIYFVFHTKASLMSAVIDSAVMGTDDPRPPQAQPWWQEMLDEPDAVRALQTFIRGAGPAFARASAIAEVLRSAALTDNEIRETYEHHETIRRDGFGQVLDSLADKAALRSDMTRDQLLDVFIVIYGDATYQLLTVGKGWSHEQVMDWLCIELPRLILEPTDRLPHD